MIVPDNLINKSGVRGYASYTTPSGTARVSPLAEDCGLRVDLPHVSATAAPGVYQIHTRAESFCNLAYVASNQMVGQTFRSRWYGWQPVGAPKTEGPATTQRLRTTVVAECERGTWHRYRTIVSGTVVLGTGTVTRTVYNENDTEILCER